MTLAERNEPLAEALDSGDPLWDLRDAAFDMLRNGASVQSVLAELEQLRVPLRRSNRPEYEDMVLEVMDFVSGWASPHVRWPDSAANRGRPAYLSTSGSTSDS